MAMLCLMEASDLLLLADTLEMIGLPFKCFLPCTIKSCIYHCQFFPFQITHGNQNISELSFILN